MCSGLTRVRSGWITLAAWSTEIRSTPPLRGVACASASFASAGKPAAAARTDRLVGNAIADPFFVPRGPSSRYTWWEATEEHTHENRSLRDLHVAAGDARHDPRLRPPGR